MNQIQTGSTMTNGASIIRLIGHATDEWAAVVIALEGTDHVTGEPCGIPDHMLRKHWRHVPFEWSPLGESGLEERYVWNTGWRSLRHETRTAVAA